MLISPEVKFFCKSFIIIIAGIFLADWLAGSGLKYLYKHQSSGLLYRANYSLDSTNADFLVFGSSRANHHYDPKIFEDKLHATFYNCGRDAQGSIYSCAMISALIERYKPKCIIIDIRLNEFTASDEGKIAALYPYNDNKIIRSYYSYQGPFEKIKLLSQIYPYNSLLTNLLIGVTSYNKKRTSDYKGYIPLNGTKEKVYSAVNETNVIDTAKVRYFKELLTKLNNRGIPAVVVISPVYGKVTDGATAKLAADMCSPFKSVKFLNFTHDPICKEGKYFNDGYHLNEEGAALFSGELIAPIQSVTSKPAR